MEDRIHFILLKHLDEGLTESTGSLNGDEIKDDQTCEEAF